MLWTLLSYDIFDSITIIIYSHQNGETPLVRAVAGNKVDTAKQRGEQQIEQNRIEQNKTDNRKGGECNRSTTKREEVVAG